MKRETAIKTAENRRIETPETRAALDYQVGDVVQIRADGKKAAGEVGVIIGIRVFEYKDGTAELGYRIKLSDKQSIEVTGRRLRFLRHAETIPTEKGDK